MDIIILGHDTLSISIFIADCGHLKIHDNDCIINWPRPLKFRTGRKDCIPDPNLDRPFFTSKHEIHPNVHANGPQIVFIFFRFTILSYE